MSDGTQGHVFSALKAGVTIITANRRLSRELVANYDRSQLESGATAWNSAEVLPLDAWLGKIWEQVGAILETQPLLLSDNQLYAIWKQVIEQDISQHEQDSNPLWNTHSSAKAAISALKIIRRHSIAPSSFASSHHPDHKCFVRWYGQFSKRCAEQDWIDHYQLSDLIAASCHQIPSQNLLLTGFERINPQLKALTESLSTTGHTVNIVDTPKADIQNLECVAYKNNQEQWRAAGQWARAIVQRHPGRRIGIVAPDLSKYRDTIEHCLKETLCPIELIEPGDAANLPYHLSLGTNLADHPVSGSGLKLLEIICARTVSITQICQLMVSPFIRDIDGELSERSALAIRLPRLLAYESSITRLLDELDYQLQKNQVDLCPSLHSALKKSAQVLLELLDKDTPANWAQHFTRILETLGWPGERNLGSDDFQALTAFRERLNLLGELDLVLGKISLTSAISWLRRRLTDQLFQFEARNSQIQVLGIQETAGLEFDYLWFGGLIESDWPPGSRPNPFIPIALQREAGVESSSTDTALRHAEIQQQRLLFSSGEIVLSRHLYDDDVQLEVSPLVSQSTAATALPADTALSLLECLHRQKPELEYIEESSGLKLDLSCQAGGGTGLIQMQSHCPRGAYARYRLGAEPLSTREQGLDPMERGSLVHRALELAWKQIKDSDSLQALSDENLAKIIDYCCKEAGRQFKIRSGCGDQFFISQARWLSALLTEWFQLEKQRTEPFQVLDTEQKAQLNLSGLDLHFSIDRIDQFDDGRIALIDYKTGSQNSVADWIEQRPASPQLPLYSIAQDCRISVVAYAQVRAGDCCYIGLSDQQVVGDSSCKALKVKDISEHAYTKESFKDWQRLQQYWKHNLETLGAEFVAGDFSVDPDATGLCSYCPTPSFCRSGDRFTDDTE